MRLALASVVRVAALTGAEATRAVLSADPAVLVVRKADLLRRRRDREGQALRIDGGQDAHTQRLRLSEGAGEAEGQGQGQGQGDAELMRLGEMAGTTLDGLSEVLHEQRAELFRSEGRPEWLTRQEEEVEEEAVAAREPEWSRSFQWLDTLLLQCAQPDVEQCVRLIQEKDLLSTARHPDHAGSPLHVVAGEHATGPAPPASASPSDVSALAKEAVLLSEMDRIRVLEALLAQPGADVNARTANGATPLHWAAGAGFAEVVQYLLTQARADSFATTYTWGRQVFGRDSGQTAAHWAAAQGHTRVLDVLANHGNPLALVLKDERDATPMQIAEKETQSEARKFLERVHNDEYVVLRVHEVEKRAVQQVG